MEKNKQLNLTNYFNENNLLGNVQALIIAGSDTTFVSLIWLLLAMASYPEVQEKVHVEVDAVLGKHETVQWVDRQRLPYCLACIMEGQRWRTVVPLNLLHRSNEHIIVNGYDIPKGTNIMTVLWAVHNDERYWENPGEFQPERFLTSDEKVIKEPEVYLPFAYGFAGVNGTEWSEQRRFTMMEMKNLGFGQSKWEKIIQMDVLDILELLEQSKGEPVDIEEPLSLGISNSVLSLVTSRRIPKGDPRRNVIENGIVSFQHLHVQTSLISFYPRLFKFAVGVGLLKVRNKVKDLFAMNKCIRKEIEESKQNRGDDSFIEKYLDEIEKNKEQNKDTSFNDSSLLGNVQALIIAGSHTTRVSLQYLLLAMASYPEIQSRVHNELDNVIGKDGSVDWSDRKKLPYCHAAILEAQRWRTIAPLSLLHMTSDDVKIYGYDIPKGTNIITVLWAFHHDPKYWKDPDAFEPSRFLSDDGKAVNEPKVFIPFSFGKRICPGKLVALIQIFQYFVPIMQKFQVLPASEASEPDLEGSLGISLMPKRQPLRFVPR